MSWIDDLMGYQIVADESTEYPSRSKIRFLGDVTITDNANEQSTDIALSGSSGLVDAFSLGDTFDPLTNVDSVNTIGVQYKRIGDIITVSGSLNIFPTAAGLATVQMMGLTIDPPLVITQGVASSQRSSDGEQTGGSTFMNTSPAIVLNIDAADNTVHGAGFTVTYSRV